MTQAQALLLAAGRGERMRPLTDQTPKPLLQVRGKPLLAWHSAALAAQGFTEQMVNAAWLSEQIAAWAQTPGTGAQVRVSNEGQDFGHALETLGGIARALPFLQDTFWVVAGDIYAPEFGFAAQDYKDFVASNYLAQVWLVPNPPHNLKGDFALSSNGQLCNPQHGLPTYTFSTITLYKKAFFQAPWSVVPVGNPLGQAAPLAPLLRRGADAGVVAARIYTGSWTDVGTPERLTALNTEL